ncbi:MAG: hypothetical protein WDO73_20195 [Ignavibacteriota bacterium]
MFDYLVAPDGSGSAVWTPSKALAAKHRAALSLWIQAKPDVKLSVAVRDASGLQRYPFEAVTLENFFGGWRQVVIPLTLRGRVDSLGIVVEPRYPEVVRGSLSIDDVLLLPSSDVTFAVDPNAALAPAVPGSERLAPRLGVNIHGIDDVRQLDAAHAAGFSFVRADLLWRAVERNGQYRFVVADRLVAATEARGMGVLWILDYGHPQHGGEVPRQPDDIAAFGRFAEAVAAHFRGRNVRYEIWNEPNIDRFWPPHPNPYEYAALARVAVEATHRGNPDAKVAIGGLARIELSFLEDVLAAGVVGDAVSVHPYRTAPPETVAGELLLLRAFVTAKLGAKVELWDTEWGYASYDYFSQALGGDGYSAAGRKRQAVLGCREVLTVWSLGWSQAVWYDIRDDGDDPRNGEKNYGLLDRKYGDKPAMVALRRVMAVASDHTFAGLVQGTPDGIHIMRLEGANRVLVGVERPTWGAYDAATAGRARLGHRYVGRTDPGEEGRDFSGGGGRPGLLGVRCRAIGVLCRSGSQGHPDRPR